MNDKLWLFSDLAVQQIFLKMNEVSLSCQGNNWQYLLPIVEFELLKKIRFWKNWICHCEFDSLFVPNTLLMTTVAILKNVVFWYPIMKCKHLEDMNNIPSQYFTDDQCIILEEHTWLKKKKKPFRSKKDQCILI